VIEVFNRDLFAHRGFSQEKVSIFQQVRTLNQWEMASQWEMA
jgi:hypothetical protein